MSTEAPVQADGRGAEPNERGGRDAPAPFPQELTPEQLRWRCDPAQLGFETSADVQPLEQLVGQRRAVDAIEFGLSVQDSRYNLYLAGSSGTGRVTTIRRMLTRIAAARRTAADWCYLHNFEDPYRPIAVELPAGRGPELARDLADLALRCRADIRQAFEGDDYAKKRTAAIQEVLERREQVMRGLVAAAAALGIAIDFTPTGINTAPLHDGQPMTAEAFSHLPDARKNEIAQNAEQVQRLIAETLPAMRRVDRDGHVRMEQLDREIALFAVGYLFDRVIAKYPGEPEIARHVQAIREDFITRLDEFRSADAPTGLPGLFSGPRPWERYGANVLITNAATDGAPVVFEQNPTFANLVGHVDYRATMGAMQTDFNMIKPGALHRANGGFLVIEARDLLTSPFAYQALTRALRDHEIRIETPDSHFGLPAATLRPAPIPLQVRVVLIGDARTYALLHQLDEDFAELFTIKAEFTPVIDRTPEAVAEYAAFVSARVTDHGLLPFHNTAIARIVEEGARIVANRDRLAARFDVIERIVIDADRYARSEGAPLVRDTQVARALAERDRRASLPEEEFQRHITDGTLVVDTRSSIVGQINGLAVMDYGDRAFARPSRITARTGIGGEGIVDVERETDQSGPSHSKGVLILTGYLLGMYGQERPLTLTARLTFEQMYGGVEGDSASAAELFAILSSLADVPLEQGIAVTGSVDQFGTIQAIGAVNEKVEGHFAICQAQGLTGRQGVVIPQANARHLMLAPEVVEAVTAGTFHVWAIATVDEGLEILSGTPAGARTGAGAFPAESVHGKVLTKLAHYGRQLAQSGLHGRSAATS